jgi:hypothetical protein
MGTLTTFGVPMNRSIAETRDRDFYADLDLTCNLYGVFGTESGFCYSLHADLRAADLECGRMRRDIY